MSGALSFRKTLDKERIALQFCPDVGQLRRVVQPRKQGRWPGSRIYSRRQIHLIGDRQAAHNALATRIAWEAGLRAHELATLRRLGERPPTSSRAWSPSRFAGGRENWLAYTVKGKGGLVREVRLSPATAADLEKVRLEQPREVVDRGIRYSTCYDLGAGSAWSKSFGDISARCFGWSRGAHGLRHTYAQTRINELITAGANFDEAKEIVSQELGHFRPGITDIYLFQ